MIHRNNRKYITTLYYIYFIRFFFFCDFFYLCFHIRQCIPGNVLLIHFDTLYKFHSNGSRLVTVIPWICHCVFHLIGKCPIGSGRHLICKRHLRCHLCILFRINFCQLCCINTTDMSGFFGNLCCILSFRISLIFDRIQKFRHFVHTFEISAIAFNCYCVSPHLCFNF